MNSKRLTPETAMPKQNRTWLAIEFYNKLWDDVSTLYAGNLYDGVIDCSGNPNYPAMTANHYYKVSVIGKIGGASGQHVEVGDEVVCITTSAGGDEATVGTSYMILEKDMYVGLWSELVITTRATTNGQLLADGTRSLIANIANLDKAVGVSVVPVVRTNNPIVTTNSSNVNITALDNAIGVDNTPIVRTNNPTVANTTINAKVQALDAAIGVTPTSVINIAAANSVNTNMSALDVAVGVLQTVNTFNGTSASINAAGTIQGDATLIASGNAVVALADGAKGVRLPLVSVGTIVTVFNTVANNDLKLWPAVGEYLNAAAQNASIKFKHATLISYVQCTYASAGHWTVTAIVGTIS